MKCKNNLRQLATGAIQYIDQYGKGRYFPKELSIIYTSKIILDPSIYVCPDDVDPHDLVKGLPCSYESAFDRAGFLLPDRMDGWVVPELDADRVSHRYLDGAASLSGVDKAFDRASQVLRKDSCASEATCERLQPCPFC